MTDSLKKIIVGLLPPIFSSFFAFFFNNRWQGNYSTWREAELKTTGYNAEEILKKVHYSLLKVKEGKGVYERDSVLFNEIQYSWPLLSGIMMAAAKCNGKIHVLDFGGSLGSTFFQNKKFLDHFSDVIWCIVEQKHFVEIGKQDFETKQLKFYSSVEECLKEHSINILILSSVIEYIENPYELLKTLISQLKVNFILIDRTPFIDDNDKIVIQTVPSSIYKASYPCHLFNVDNFNVFFTSNGFTLLEKFDAIDGRNKKINFKGMIYYRHDF